MGLENSTSSIPPSWKQSIGLVRSKEIVVASLKDDDTSWVAEYLSDWNANIYVVDDPRSELTVPMNKARESMVYLTYIIDRFEKLPDVMIFMHSNRYQWHNDDPIYDAVPIIQSLRLPHVYKVGYAPLRCTWIPGCPAELHPLNPTDTGPEGRQRSEVEYAAVFEKMLPNTPVPPVVGAPCSAQFAVTRNQVMKRSKESYELIRRWVMETDLPDAVCGRVMEYMWHIIMQMPPVYCPPAAECYCMTFGLCNLTCSSVAKCENRYILPTHSRIPEGWPEEGGGENGWPAPGWNEL
ncbi:predicted protein [Histoplasma mississippiense (nom. inval.)]|uniref:predicted protein n=1 Tax=Ajellomyces capsulatus (strain NAm1 / WU24) TaxID=2059318 RepID=UPI000157CD8D|nr:predicted protein [Histoplasma mississippiense (nom. inval.)]EDN10164.1 predicted protein [Histoplasma mississippiense (nom. inval.)]